MKGKPWTIEEEKQLQRMLQAGRSVRLIAKTLGKTRDSVRIKMARLGLEVVVQPKSERTTTTNLQLPPDLPSIEDMLKKMSAALTALETPGLDPAETLRLRSIIQGVKIYKELFEDFVHYRDFEAEFLDYKRRTAEGSGKKA